MNSTAEDDEVEDMSQYTPDEDKDNDIQDIPNTAKCMTPVT